MDCREIQEFMSLYIDNELSENDINELENHIQTCKSCRNEFSQILDVIDNLKKLPELELPDNFHNEIVNSIKHEFSDDFNKIQIDKRDYNKFNIKKFMTKHFKTVSITGTVACLAIIILSSLLPLSKNSSPELYSNSIDFENKISNETSTYSENPESFFINSDTKLKSSLQTALTSETNADKQINSVEENQNQIEHSVLKASLDNETTLQENQVASKDKKIIKNANVKLEVYDFKESVKKLENIGQELGGYIESSNSYISQNDTERNVLLESGEIILKVPNQNYNSAISSINDLGTVINKNETSQDITLSYKDTESLMKAKRLEEERLLAIMEKTEKVEELIILEERLSKVRGEIEIYIGRINNWDDSVNFSTIIINLEQVKEMSSIDNNSSNLFNRMKKSFINSINNIKFMAEEGVILFAQIVPLLIIIIVVIVVIFGIIKIIKKFKNNRF